MTEIPFTTPDGFTIDLANAPGRPFASGLDVGARLASLADFSVTLNGTIDNGSPLAGLLSGPPPRRDLAFTPDADQPVECPECHEPVREVFCEGALIEGSTTETDKRVITVIGATDMIACEYRPCGHRFDGKTGALIEATP